jgi:hypothetical protein
MRPGSSAKDVVLNEKQMERWKNLTVVNRREREKHSSHLPFHLFSPKWLRLGAWVLGHPNIFQLNSGGGGRVEVFFELREKGRKTTRQFEAAILGSFGHHFHLFLLAGCMDFFVLCLS